jgi:hypothetical protein
LAWSVPISAQNDVCDGPTSEGYCMPPRWNEHGMQHPTRGLGPWCAEDYPARATMTWQGRERVSSGWRLLVGGMCGR